MTRDEYLAIRIYRDLLVHRHIADDERQSGRRQSRFIGYYLSAV